MDILWGNTTQYYETYWGWPIAVYLFLAGLSGGVMSTALFIKWKKEKENTRWDGFIKAGALLAFPAILLGQGLLIYELGKPSFFYLLLLHQQVGSVMSLGVIILMVYTPLALLFAFIVFENTLLEHELSEWWFHPLQPVIDFARSVGGWLDVATGVAAVCLMTYTGFLLNSIALKPLFHVPMLPLLFLLSGCSAGIAANILVGITVFRGSISTDNLIYMLILASRSAVGEMIVLSSMFIFLFALGGEYALVAKQALSTGIWAWVFWIGVVGVGLVIPSIIIAGSLRGVIRSARTIVINSGAILTGGLLLRLYILYAGQIFDAF